MEGIVYQDVQGDGFVEGIAGQFANCRVWFDDEKNVVGITALGDVLPGASTQEGAQPAQDAPQESAQTNVGVASLVSSGG